MKQITFKRELVETRGPATGFIGHATGLLIAGSVQCIVITSTREDAQIFMDELGTTPGDSRFSCPVAMVQMKDVSTIQPPTEAAL